MAEREERKPKLDENGLPVADPPKREDEEGAERPMKRMGRADMLRKLWVR